MLCGQDNVPCKLPRQVSAIAVFLPLIVFARGRSVGKHFATDRGLTVRVSAVMIVIPERDFAAMF